MQLCDPANYYLCSVFCIIFFNVGTSQRCSFFLVISLISHMVHLQVYILNKTSHTYFLLTLEIHLSQLVSYSPPERVWNIL